MEVLNKRSGKRISAAVADSPWKRGKGLMLRKSGSMLFIFDNACEPKFWMLGMRFPIRIAFIGKDKRVVEVYHAAPWSLNPLSWKLYYPRSPIRYVLEVEAGVDIMEGDEMHWKE